MSAPRVPVTTGRPNLIPKRFINAAALLLTLAVVAPAAAAQNAAGNTAPQSPAAPIPSTGPFEGLFAAGPLEPSRPSAATVFEQPEQPPKRQHTGFQALIRTLGSDFKAFPRRKSTWVILAIGAAAAAAVSPADDEITEEFYEASARKWFAPGRVIGSAYFQASAAVGTYVLGRYIIKPGGQKSNKLTHIGFDLLRGMIVSQAFTFGIKYAFQRDRPSGECCSFPSGHASAAFASASILERHFGYRNTWPTFVIGGYVAASRLFDYRHFLSDVLFGSALGMASGWTIVGRHGRNDFALMPMPTHGGVAVVATWTPAAHHTESLVEH